MRGEFKNKVEYAGGKSVVMEYTVPMIEIISTFFDNLKSITNGFGSFDYEGTVYREIDLCKLRVVINGEEAPGLAMLVAKDNAYKSGKLLVETLRDVIPPKQFKIHLQAAIGKRVIAAVSIPAIRKNVTERCSGGDPSRKKKLLDNQAKDNYDGFRLEADRQITSNMQVSHSLFLGTIMSELGYLYQIGTNYASSDGNCLAMAKIGLDGMITARAFSKQGDYEIKGSGNSFLRYDTRNAYEAGVDYVGNGWTASLKGAWQGTWILNAAYTQQLLPSLTLGSELTYVVANGTSIGAIAGRYVSGGHIFTCQWSKQPNFKSMDYTIQETDTARMQYVRRINERLALATELEVTPATKESALHHLCNDESSNIDSTSSSDETYASARCEEDEQRNINDTSPTDSRTQTHSLSPSVHSDIQSRSADGDGLTDGDSDGSSSEDEPVAEADPFEGFTTVGHSNGGGKTWGKSVFSALNIYNKASKLVSKTLMSPREPETEADADAGPWDDFACPQSAANNLRIITGEISGPEDMHVALQNRGFYTIFLRTQRAVDRKKQGIDVFKVKFTYKILDFKRQKIEVKPNGGAFITHGVFGDDNFSFANQGTVTVTSKATKILLIYATQDAIGEFSISSNLLNMKPTVFYRIVHCGWCSPVPLSISPRFKLRILSIDSCDNLGTTALAALYAIEQRLSSIQGINSNISDYFDLICASGSGAIIALCLLKGYSARELRVQWQSILEQLFKWRHSMTYGLISDDANVNNFVRSWIDILGTDFMCSKPRPLCALTSTNVKATKRELFVFRNYTNVYASYGKTAIAPMWLAGWASNALPTYMK
ncbi:putative translation factor protein [Babesia sp. Xinjiang]|uniref:putative translation factor protein n=1 Tax=Babesia sp. Xinjiang TaxID=462227 RepID=UPI000A257182|nr:putative translation factor protein [Babesia sp. Xinjiang]ORM42324.1 putative translation factor protein [Babesia sp. Xinjiang]